MTDDDIVKALAGARKDEAPPADVEGRTQAALRAAGLVGRTRRPLRDWLFAAAALAAAVVAGFWIGVNHRKPAPGGSQFLLLLYEDAAFEARHRDDIPQLEAEYSDWIRSLARSGHALAGEKLAWRGAELRGGQPPRFLPDSLDPNTANGFFIIVAEDEQRAIAMAETCPHLKYGGRVVVRPIVTTR